LAPREIPSNAQGCTPSAHTRGSDVGQWQFEPMYSGKGTVMNSSRTRWRLLSLLATLSLCAVLVQAATASPGQRPQTADVSLAPSLAVRTTGAQEALKVAYSPYPSTTTTSTTFLDVPGTVISVDDPSPNNSDLLVMRFSGESICSGGGSNAGFCLLRILVDGIEANPGQLNDFVFDSTNYGRETGLSQESHAIERSACVGYGRHLVQVQFKTNRPDVAFRLDDWHLSVERSHGYS
jgi:hypothetical protein